MSANVKYPTNDITPHGWYYLTQGQNPTIRLRAYDGSIDIYLMGGHSIADRYGAPECVMIKRGGLKGLIPPWKHIDQKGATEDGVSNVDTLIDPSEIQLDLRCVGRDGRRTRQVVRDVIASIDGKKESELSFFDLDAGYWWSKVRWFQGGMTVPFMGGQQRRQDLSLRLRGDRGFWRSYDDTTSFNFGYETLVENFDVDYSAGHTLGPNWPQYYSGPGAGYCSTTTELGGHQVRWYESGSQIRTVVNGPYKGFSNGSDNQIVEVLLGTMPEVTFTGGAYNDVWARMGRNPDGTWDGNGIRARIGLTNLYVGWVRLSRFNGFTETMLAEQKLARPPMHGEKFRLLCGVEGNPRMFRIARNGVASLSHKEVGTGSMLGAAYRGIGFGMEAGDTDPGQRAPAWVRRITAGDNATITQSGFLQHNNIGDQPMYLDFTAVGPFQKLRIWNGPGASADDYVEFGPLLANQTAYLRTDPRDRNVYDLAAVSANPTQQERQIFESAINGLLSFLTLTNANPLLQVIQSVFGIFGGGQSPTPPQGSYYALLKGRFSDAAAIPAKSPGNPVQPYHIKVEMVGGNADSKIISAGTPLRRYPL